MLISRRGGTLSVDERIEKLTERHEALTQTMELMVLENRKRDQKWEKRFGEWERQFGLWEKRFGQILGALESLTHIAESHEHRLDDLEGTA